MTDEIVVQVKIDLDNDGWTNEGVPIGTPSNVFPRSPYTTGTKLKGLQYTTANDVYEDVQDVSKQGLMKRKVKMGKDGGGDYGESIHMSFGDYYSIYQRHLTDPINLTPVSNTGALNGVYVPSAGASAVANAYWARWNYPALGDDLGFGNYDNYYRYLIGLDYNLGGIHGLHYDNEFLDVPEQYTAANGLVNKSIITTMKPDYVNTNGYNAAAPFGQLDIGGTSTNSMVRQSFPAYSTQGQITKVKFLLDTNVGSPTGTATIEIRTNSGSDMSATVLYTGTITPTANAMNTHTLSSPLTVATGTYWLVIRSTAVQTLNNYWRVKGTTLALAYAGGSCKYGSTALPQTTILDVHVVIEQSLAVTAATATWQGLSVTAGNTYTLTVFAQYTGGNTMSVPFRMRVYGNSATLTAPNYGRVYLAGADYTFTTTQEIHAFTFTLAIPVGTSQIAIDTFTLETGVAFSVGGIILSAGVVTHPTDRFYDNATVYGEGQFAVLAEANKDYTLSFWAKSADGINDLTGNLATAKIGYSIGTLENTHSLVITSDWIRHDFTVSTQTYLRGIGFVWATKKGGVATGLGNVGTIEFKGFMLVEGSTPTPYQVGPIAAYDDVTANVLAFDTKSGKDSFLDALAYEGIANIQLNNVSKIYSPNNQSSPLYGYLIQNLRVEIMLGGVSIWQGWVTEYEVSAGLYEERQVSLTCKQGMYRLQEGEFSAAVQIDAKIDDVLRDIVDNSGWKPTSTPFYSVLGFNSLLDESFYLNDVDGAFSRADEGINTLEITGLDWGRETAVDTAIKDLLDSESAMLWIDRNGKLVLVNREYWVNRVPDQSYNIDYLPYMTNAEYVYGQDMVNRVQVSLNAKRQTLDAPVWKTYRAVYVKPNDNRYLEINPQYQEGRQRTVVRFTLEGATKTGYLKDPGMTYENTESADSADMDKVVLELFPDVGNRYRLRITNGSAKGIWVDVEIKGDYLETADETLYVYEDTDAIEQTGAIHYEEVSSPLLSREYEAQAMAAFRILRAAYPDGEFKSLEFTLNRFMLTEFTALIATELGNIIDLSESQTGEVLSPHAVIAEEFSFNGGIITIRFILARAQKERYFELNTNALYNSTANMIEDMTNVLALDNSGVASVIDWGFEGLETIILWDLKGIGGGDLLLNPSRGQYVEYNAHDKANVWPELTAASVDTTPSRIFYTEFQPSGPPYSILVSGYTDEETGVYTSFPVWETRLSPTNIGVNWRLLYGAQLFGTKQGDTIFKAMGILPVLLNTKYRVSANYYESASGSYAIRVHKQFDTLATGIATLASTGNLYHELEFNSGDAMGVALDFYGNTTAANILVQRIRMLQMGNVEGTPLDTTVTHKYTVYMKIDPKQSTHSVTLNVYGVDGTVIATQTQTVGYTLTKFEVTIPTGANSNKVWAMLHMPVTSSYMHRVYIYAHGVTVNSVTDVSELLTPVTQTTLYL